MKNIKYIILSIAICGFLISCDQDDSLEGTTSIQATGDDADDPAEPDEQEKILDNISNYQLQATADDADDPAEPEDEN